MCNMKDVGNVSMEKSSISSTADTRGFEKFVVSIRSSGRHISKDYIQILH